MAANRRITKKQMQIHLRKQQSYKKSNWDYNKIKHYIENLPDEKINDVIDTFQYQSYQGFEHEYSRTLLHIATCRRMTKTVNTEKQLDLIRLCLNKGADINIHLAEPPADLVKPIINILNDVSNVEIARFLITRGADINHKSHVEDPRYIDPYRNNMNNLVCNCIIYHNNYELAKLYINTKLKQ